MLGFTANFGKSKSGLSTVQWAWLDSAGDVIGSWTGGVLELEAGTGIYYINETPLASTYWLAWRTGEVLDELFLVLGVQEKSFTFDFGMLHTGKIVGYRFFTENNTPIAPEIIADVIEFMEAGIYLALNVVILPLAVFVKARTVETESAWVAGAIDFDSTVYTQTPRTGPRQEEV